MIPYGRQTIDDDDVAAVVEVLRSDRLTQGPIIERFEEALASYVGADHAVAFTSGTAALHGACAVAELGPGSRVGVPALTFSGSAACARYVGAEPVLLDIDPTILNLDPTTVPKGLDALIAVHYAGLPIDLTRIVNRPRLVIEDACHALGATSHGRAVGSCAHSEMSCFSFHPVKAITTAEGGAVTTNDANLAERLRRFRNHGIVPLPDQDGPWYYEVQGLGFNYRLSDLHAALGLSQLRRIDSFIERRNEIAVRYDTSLPTAVARAPRPVGEDRHAFHLYPARVPDRRRVVEGLREAGVLGQVHYVPLYRHPVYRAEPEAFPGTEAAYKGLISLPMFPDLLDAEQDAVIAAPARGAGAMTDVAIMQPTFLPWLGYFDLMAGVDSYVVLDNVQFSYQSWQHRNRVRTARGLSWLTVPVRRADRFDRMDRVEIASADSYPDRLLNQFDESYRASSHWAEARSLLEPLERSRPGDLLVDLNLSLLGELRRVLEVTTPLVRASSLDVQGKRSELLVAICQEVGADRYITPPGAVDYLLADAHLFHEAGIEIAVHSFAHPEYSQCFEPFLSHASAIDAVANVGSPAATLLRTGRVDWHPLTRESRGA